jgi:C-terminal processing protease CtpA/Prc
VLFGENILENFSPEIHWLVSFRPGAVARDTMNFREIFEHFRKSMKGGGLDKLADVPVVLGIGTKTIPQEDGAGEMVQIAAVLPGYPSWERLKVGDIILSVDGRKISSQAPQKELHKKIAGAGSASSVQFGILRKGKKIEIDVPLARQSLHQTVRSIELLGKVLRTLGAKFGRIDLACRYTSEGQILLDLNFIAKSIPAATTQPVTRPVEAR